MITISLCMIVKNEENTLDRCLSSVMGFVDEVIIVDTGSTDRTKDIAAKFTDKIFDFEWTDDFSAARNFSFEQATMDFIMWLDADDIFLPEDATKLINLKQSLPPEIDGVMMKYNTGFDSAGNVVFSFYRKRLSRRNGNFKWREPVHEYLEVGVNVINANISVTHAKPPERRGNRNILIYEKMIDCGKELSPRGTYYYARELKDNARFPDAINRFLMFLDSELGWKEDNITACGELSKCYLAVNKPGEALAALFRSFTYDTPRAEICCQIGYCFKYNEKYNQAAFWFNQALNAENDEKGWNFRQDDCRGYIPNIELAVCHDKLGNYERAKKYNEKALEYKPDSVEALNNKIYFDSRCP